MANEVYDKKMINNISVDISSNNKMHAFEVGIV